MRTPFRRLTLPTLLTLGVTPFMATSVAQAQSPNPSVVQTREANLMMLVDTSRGMGLAFDGTPMGTVSCQDINKKTRWAALAEIMTGTIGNLNCGYLGPDDGGRPRWVGVASGECVPGANDNVQVLNDLEADPRYWPRAPGGGQEEAKRAIRFMEEYDCKNGDCNEVAGGSSGLCDVALEEDDDDDDDDDELVWIQADDGLIDEFEETVRFGMMTMDPLKTNPSADCLVAPTLKADADGNSNWTFENNVTTAAYQFNGVFGGYGGNTSGRYPAWSGNNGFFKPNGNDSSPLWARWYIDQAGRMNTAFIGGGGYFPREFSYWCDYAGSFATGCAASWWDTTADRSGYAAVPLVFKEWCQTPGPITCGAALDPADDAWTNQTTADAECIAADAANCNDTNATSKCRCNLETLRCERRTAFTGLDTADIGGKNSAAPPWEGRLIGFDPASTETDAQRRMHNNMVEQALLGTGPYDYGAPISAMMRDAKEFILADDVTRGDYLPDDPVASAQLVLISPSQDAAFTDVDRCRQTHIVLITQGEPYRDISVPASTFTGEMFDEDIYTFVVGVGEQKVVWDQDGDGTLDAGTEDDSVRCEGLRDNPDLEVSATTPTGALPAVCTWDDTLKIWAAADGFPYANALNSAQRSSIRACCTMLDIAVAGGTERVFAPESQAYLKTTLSEVFTNIAGGTLSRTVPVFSQASAAYVAGNTSYNSSAPATFFELRSSLEIPIGVGLWTGHLERVRYQCDAVSDFPERIPIDPDAGDLFGKNLSTTATWPRKFLTVAVQSENDFDETIRPADPSDWCALCTIDTDEDDLTDHEPDRMGGDADNDDLVEIDDLAAALETASATPLEDIFDISGGGDRGQCGDALGDGSSLNEDECAFRVLKWWGGHADPCEGDDCPTLPRRTTASCEDCSSLGAIFKSNPVIVGPPAPDLADQSYANERATTATAPSFVEDHGTRPTMLYAQSVEGQLHAFVLAKNFYGTSGTYDTDLIPDPTSEQNNELWTFVPPIVMPTLWDNFGTQTRLADGPITAENVVYRRDAADLAAGAAKWATVIVGSGGPGLGGYYYAIDVTNPLEPRFLWQLSKTSGNDALFGQTTSGAAITHLLLDEGAGQQLVAVAVLPGGGTDENPGGDRLREVAPSTYWTGGDWQPRARVRDWDDGPARTLTFVELATGRIISRLTSNGTRGDGSEDDCTPAEVEDDILHGVGFDSPITGIPAAYPFATGEPATRIYVGDADGTMWRVNVQSPDPDNWTARIAWDPYNDVDATEKASLKSWVAHGGDYGKNVSNSVPAGVYNDMKRQGQPIMTAPLIALDDRGVPVVMFATGDQETFQTPKTDMINWVVSFTDEPNLAVGTGFAPTMNDSGGNPLRGLQVAFLDGARATGPLTVYDGQLIYSFFEPGNGTTCTSGSGGVCAYRFNERQTTADRPYAFLDLQGDGDIDLADACDSLDDGEVVFGLTINQVPSCVVSTEEFNDPWLAGKYTSQTASNAPGYQLVMHTGEGGDESDDDGAKTRVSHVDLPKPRSTASISSWVSALE